MKCMPTSLVVPWTHRLAVNSHLTRLVLLCKQNNEALKKQVRELTAKVDQLMDQLRSSGAAANAAQPADAQTGDSAADTSAAPQPASAEPQEGEMDQPVATPDTVVAQEDAKPAATVVPSSPSLPSATAASELMARLAAAEHRAEIAESKLATVQQIKQDESKHEASAAANAQAGGEGATSSVVKSPEAWTDNRTRTLHEAIEREKRAVAMEKRRSKKLEEQMQKHAAKRSDFERRLIDANRKLADMEERNKVLSRDMVCEAPVCSQNGIEASLDAQCTGITHSVQGTAHLSEPNSVNAVVYAG